jgi:hypothetical protein
MTFKVTLKVTGVNCGLLFGTLAHICRHHKNAENSVPECSKVLDLAIFRVLAIYRAPSGGKCPYLTS